MFDRFHQHHGYSATQRICPETAGGSSSRYHQGLDPNFTHKAWGGPSYVGAMFCHYLDGALLYPVCHTLPRRVTAPARRES